MIFMRAFRYLFFLLLAVSAFASNSQVVRVGWFDGPFNLKDASGRRSGYAYEYQQKIATFTGWTYEYVEGSWSTLYEKLRKGEIDLLADVSHTEERAKNILYSQRAMGEEEYYAFVSPENESLSPENFHQINGKKIGVNKGSIQKTLFEKWAERNGVVADIIESSDGEKENAENLKNGKFDVFLGLESLGRFYDLQPVKKIGSTEIYFAVNKKRKDLLTSLDSAMDLIYDENRYYNLQLYERYQSNVESNAFLNLGERAWIKSHGKIRVGYRKDFLPYSGNDAKTGQFRGILNDFMNVMSERFFKMNIPYEPVPYQDMWSAIRDMKEHKIDCVFPIYMNVYEGEKQDLLISNKILAVEMFAVIRNADAEGFSIKDSLRVAYNADNLSLRELLKERFPHWKIIPFATAGECLKSVRDKRTDVFLINSHRMNRFYRTFLDYNLTTITTGVNLEAQFVLRHEDVSLLSIINKTRNLIPDATVESFVITNSIAENHVGLIDFLRAHFLLATGVLLFVLLVMVVLLLRALKMERRAVAAQNAKSDFLSKMSHDIRTPMNIIVGLVNIAKKNFGDEKKQEECINKISAESEYLQKLVNDVLDISAIEAGKLKLHLEAEQIDKIEEAVELSVQGLLLTKPVGFSCNRGEILSPCIKIDCLRVKQVLENLLSNAIKYTPTSGKVRFTFWQEKISESKLLLCLEVFDTGIGMSEEFMKNMYSEFARGIDTRVNKIQGTGLGLAIVKKLVDLMHGEISVTSRLNEGSKFVVKIPVEAVDACEKVDSAKPDVSILKGMNILVVEDNDLNYEIAFELLKDLGVSITRAENGQIAVDKFRLSSENFFGFILMDMQMPVMDGLQATREIRALHRSDAKTVPIVAMTANAFAEDAAACREAGMNGHLAKPMNVDEVIAVMLKWRENKPEG